jgi:hypothetical protein
MKITSERWQIISLPIILLGILYIVAGRFSRHTTGDLVVASLTSWDAVVLITFYLWWWPMRRAFQAGIGRPPPRARILLLSSILASAVSSVGLMLAGIGLLEQDGLGLQILGGLLLILAALILPGWSLWLIRWTSRRMNTAVV